MKSLLEIGKISEKDREKLRYFFLVIFFCEMFYAGIRFMNAGVSYEQAVSFRLFCIGFGLMVIALMDVKQWFTIWSLIYLPVCYVFTHIAYERHWIEDTCEYQFVDIIRQGKLVILIWGIILIAVVRDLIRNRDKQIKKFHPLLGALWFLFIILLTLFKRGYFYATFFVICVTAFYWSIQGNKRQQAVWNALQDALILSFFYVLFMSVMRRPYDCERYPLYFVNANSAGEYLACVIAVLFARIDRFWKNWHMTEQSCRKKYMAGLVIYYVLMGIACALAIFNYTRTTIMGMGFSFIVLFIVQMLKEERKRRVLLEYGLIILSVASLFHATFFAIRYVPAYMNVPYYFMGEFDPETRIAKDDPIDSPKYTTIESFLTLALGKWGIYVDFSEENKTEESNVVIDTDRDVTNGRLDIWQAYLEKANWTGHYPGHMTLENGFFIYHAHSTYIHILYQYGILTGIIYALMVMSAFIISVIYVWRNYGCGSAEFILAMLITGICLIGQITEWMGHPAYVICMMQYMMYGMLLCNPKQDSV